MTGAVGSHRLCAYSYAWRRPGAPAGVVEVKKIVLANGFTVLISRNPAAPLACFNLYTLGGLLAAALAACAGPSTPQPTLTLTLPKAETVRPKTIKVQEEEK